PTVNLSSTPYLAEKDVLLLLLTGRKPQKSTGTGVSETEWGDMAFFVSKNLYKSFVNGDEPEQEYLAERFTLDIGRETTKQGDNTIEARFFINDGFWLPNDQLFMVAEKDVWDDYHLGLRLVFRYF
ncbi:MAG: hypothetical protein OEV64_01560, partial [Desulfobulbaceae bacterium]|nr:hypothetical protein [Desulfobulbaceae bacterium]